MNDSVQQHIGHNNDDEIDLFELFSTIWQEKIKIILITSVFMLGALVYAFNATEKWSVSATVDIPTPHQVKQYNLNRVLVNDGIKTLNNRPELNTSESLVNIQTNDKDKDNNELPTIKELHKLFINEARMTTNQVNFFKNQSLFKTTIAEEQLNQAEQNNFAYKWVAENISFAAEDKNKVNFNNKIGTEVTISATRPEDALALNQAYFRFINDIMMTRLRDSISSELTLALQKIASYDENKTSYDKIILEKQIKAIEIDIQIAKQANIKNFVTQHISLRSAPEYAKGYEILTAEKFVLTQQLANYEKNSTIKNSRALIKKWRDFDKTMQLDDFNFYRFTDEAKLPQTRDKPKRALILVLGTLLGLMLSVAYVLVMNVVGKHKNTSQV